MYKIRGADGKEYGPVSADALRDWVNQGRANGQTLVLAEGTTEWKPLSSFAEFSAQFVPPAPGMTGGTGSVPIAPQKTSGLAIASLVLGCIGFVTCGATALIGLPLGIVAIIKVKNSQGRLTGWGLALAGTIVSAVALLLLPIFAAMLLPALAKAKSKAQSINCVNNVKQLNLGVLLYADGNNGKFPAATNWCDATVSGTGSPKIYVCPGSPNLRSGYAFNTNLSGLESGNIDPRTVLIFESDAGWNASGGKEMMISKPRHYGRYIIGFADGSVQQMTAAQVAQLRWDPRPQPGSNQTNP